MAGAVHAGTDTRRADSFALASAPTLVHCPEGSSIMKRSTLLNLISSAVLLFPIVADALDMPQPKLGLWEMRTQNSYDGAPLTAVDTSQFCWDASHAEKQQENGRRK